MTHKWHEALQIDPCIKCKTKHCEEWKPKDICVRKGRYEERKRKHSGLGVVKQEG